MHSQRHVVTPKQFQVVIWSLAAATILAALAVWRQRRLNDGEVTLYELFPLLGLTAFSLMWTHYIAGAWRRLLGFDKTVLRRYFQVTSVAVLALILLHPAVLVVQLWQDGLGLPPFSYFQVYPDLPSRVAILLSTVGLVTFLAFELHRKFRNATWWKYVEYAAAAAMFLIFYHALTLGGEVSHGWYQVVWWIYGITLIGAIIYTYHYDNIRAA